MMSDLQYDNLFVLCLCVFQNSKLLQEPHADSGSIQALLTQTLNQLPESHPQLELATSLVDLVHVL